ncbi:MAG: hypothetical protein Q8O72_10690 [Bacteroidales bacterium]|nr:hypothetical protein [Bacteroidales bacterium]
MNKLKTTDIGGFPLRLDDLRWLDDAQREAFMAVIKTLIGEYDYARLFGCDLIDTEQGTIECTSGYVYFNDEIFYVEPSWVNDSFNPSQMFFVEDVSYDTPAGLKTFEDTTTHETYEIRRATMVGSLTTPPASMPAYSPNFITILKARLDLYEPPLITAWEVVPFTTSNVSIVGGALSSVEGNMKYKVKGKITHAIINLKVTISTLGSMIKIVLPGTVVINQNVFATNLMHNLQGGGAKYPVVRLMAWNDTTHLSIASIISGEDLDAGNYDFYGEITFENV